MKLTLEPTKTVTTLVVHGVEVPARCWVGTDETGQEVYALITRVCLHKDAPVAAHERFAQELRDVSDRTTPAAKAFDLRFFID